MKTKKWLLATMLIGVLAALFRPVYGYFVFGQLWPNGDIVMHAQLGTSGTMIDGATSWGESAEWAMSDWNVNMRNAQFAVVRNSTASIAPGDGTNSVFFSSTVFGQPFGSSTLAVTTRHWRRTTMTEADIAFNNAKVWNSYRGPLRRAGSVLINDFRRVAEHELGHVLGLGHPDDIGQTVVAQMNSFEGDLDHLAADDIAGAQVLYGVPSALLPRSDFNSDGTTDLVWRHDGGAICVWFMNGINLVSSTFFNPSQTDPSWKIAGVGDFNQDGKPDLVWRHDGGAICVWFMNGATLLSSSFFNPSTTDPSWKISGVGDFNQDGKPDLLWRHDSGVICVWFMNGINLLSSAFLNPSQADPTWKIAGVGDFNQDGKPDLVWRHDAGSIGVWFMDGLNQLSGLNFNPGQTDPSWKISGVGDFNQDGKPDLIWRHDGGGACVWYMDGINLLSSPFLNPGQVDPSWKIQSP
jgi:hypothetical protein